MVRVCWNPWIIGFFLLGERGGGEMVATDRLTDAAE